MKQLKNFYKVFDFIIIIIIYLFIYLWHYKSHKKDLKQYQRESTEKIIQVRNKSGNFINCSLIVTDFFN